MPSRILRESITTSPTLDQICHGAECTFYRLTTKADDAGRFDADSRVVLANCFPLRVGRLKPTVIEKYLMELSRAGLIRLYTVDARRYGHFVNWAKHQRTYNLKSKFPQPPAECGKFPQPPGNSGSYPISENRESRIDKSIVVEADTALTPEKLQERWNAIPGVKPCKEIGKTIRDRIHTRITEHSNQEWWDRFFQMVQASQFLCGRTDGTQGPFHVSLTWILAPKNLDKLLAGDYDLIASNGHVPAPTCTKRIQNPGDRFLRPCGQPASPESRPTEPRCSQHLSEAAQSKELIHAH